MSYSLGASDFTTGTPVTTMGGATVGPDHRRQPYPGDARYWVSDARWVQRAINAWRAAGAGRGALIVVDGQAGPITMTALRAVAPGQPEPANYPSGRVTSQVRIAKSVADQLAALPIVADPRPASRASTPTRPAGAPPGSEALAPVDAASSAPLRDEGSQNFWNEPWFMPAAVVGGVVLVAGGGLVWWGRTGRRAVKANRRRGRRVKRNTHGDWESKVHRVIAILSRPEWERANRLPDGKVRKRHQPYRVPQEVDDLVAALGDHDRRRAERRAKQIMEDLRLRGAKID